RWREVVGGGCRGGEPQPGAVGADEEEPEPAVTGAFAQGREDFVPGDQARQAGAGAQEQKEPRNIHALSVTAGYRFVVYSLRVADLKKTPKKLILSLAFSRGGVYSEGITNND